MRAQTVALAVLVGLVAPGRAGATDPTWSTMAPMSTARRDLGVASVGNTVYAIGGANNTGSSYFSSVEAYDPATNTWVTKAPLPTGRQSLATAVAGGKIYAIGGSSSSSATRSRTGG